MIVLIADKFEESGVRGLKEAGCEVIHQPTLQGDELREAIAKTRCQILIVRSTRVTEDMLAAGEQLNLVVRAGAGYNTIDVAAAARRSIFVANCPGKNAIAVAELTFALILALDRRIADNVAELRQGVWNKKSFSVARGLKGRTLGILGFGRIGQEVATRAQAFGMEVVAWSRSLTEEMAEEWGIERCETPGVLAARCDVLSIHLAAAPETKNLVNGDVLSRLRPGSYVINTARADVLDYGALATAIKEQQVRAGLDVFPSEPAEGSGSFTPEILKAGGVVYGTHHIGASTDQAQEAIAAETVRIVTTYMNLGRVENCVNLCVRSPAQCVVVVRHKNRPGVLAHALGVIRAAGINVEEMQNVIFDGAEAACAQIKLDNTPSDAVVRQIQSENEHVVGVSVMAIS
jgi:D-3-phosphoglycerate dehydrogenase / 2-oxoglutarate reductase